MPETANVPEPDRLRAAVGSGSLSSLLAWRALERPEHGFLFVEDDPVWTFGELAAAAATTDGRLAEDGIAAGSRVLIRIGNDERFVPCLVAAWLRAGVAVPMHPAAPVDEVRRVVSTLSVDAVLADPEDPVFGADLPVPVLAVPRLEHPATVEAVPLTVPAEVSGADPALILLTSGSTGAPKGVLLTHDNAWSNLRSTVSAFRSDTGPSPLPDGAKPPNLIANPVSHTAGVVRLLFALYVGRSIVLLRKFNGALAKRLVDQHGIDNLTLNPAMLRMLLDDTEPGDTLGRVRYASSGTAPLTPALRTAFEERFGIPVLQAYGQTESFGGIAIESVKDVLAGRRRPGSVGKPLPGVELRLVDDQGQDVAPGASGEIWVRSKSAMKGYLTGSDEAPTSTGEWLHTGDLGRFDDDGYLFITGRLKNIIICGGFNIAPEEVEAALESDDRVNEAVVVSWPDERLGEIPVAVVETSAAGGEVMATVAPKLSAYKRPRKILRVDRLPRVPNGKVDRPAVLRLVAQAASSTEPGAAELVAAAPGGTAS
ncbi:class I adenylate-forming enzyme family protein [uncultured Jatrophihabitans sp.]|uniref:class I adenylate-forming enzyme family protein n=1 Tax=uncultured Jatrophihabitans sp. TaxID=1610747 RepID=UPI0035CB8938